MKISIFTTLGNIGNTPDYWQYAWKEALESYLDFADEVVVVSGDNSTKLPFYHKENKVKFVNLDWAYDFSWETIAQHFNAGLEACTGDWILKMDIDYILHEKDFNDFRAKLDLASANDFKLASYMKATVLNKDKWYQKLAVPFCIRGDMKEKYKFGIPNDGKPSAWGYPILAEGFDKERGLPTGKSLPECVDDVAFRTGINVLNS